MMLYHGRWGPKVILRVVALLVVPRVGPRARRYLWGDGSECAGASGAVYWTKQEEDVLLRLIC